MRLLSGIILLVLALLGGCRRQHESAAPPPPTVTVAHPIQHEVIDWDNYNGRLEAPQAVDVRAQVSGQIIDEPFQEGAIVKQGTLLFVIDPRPFQAALDTAKADAAKAQAAVTQANAQYQRTRQAASAVSEQELTNTQAALQQAKAQLQAAQAEEKTAELNLGWTRVVAPIAGRVGRKQVTMGNLVTGGATNGTLLTTIVSIDPIYCYVDAPEPKVLQYQKLARERKRVSAREGRVPAFLQLPNETGFPHEGYIDFVANRADPGTGTLRGRGVFPNPDGILVPGFSAEMRVPGRGPFLATLVPDAAVVTQQNLRLLMVVNRQDVVQARPVELGNLFGTLRAIDKGVTPANLVVINGLLRARPGAKVTPQIGTISLESLPSMTMPATQPTSAPAPPTQPSAQTPAQAEGKR